MQPRPEPVADPSKDRWQLRAADADREAYVDQLQRAYVDGRLSRAEYDERMAAALEAVTYAQLRPLVADLPVEPGALPEPPGPAAPPAVRPTGVPVPVSAEGRMLPVGTTVDQPPMVAVLSEATREGRWAVGRVNTAVAVLGSAKLDLCDAFFESTRVEIRANAILGSVEIEVPDDMRVEVSGVGILGEFGHRNAADQPHDAAIVVVVSGVALLGSVAITTVPAPGRRGPAGPAGIDPGHPGPGQIGPTTPA